MTSRKLPAKPLRTQELDDARRMVQDHAVKLGHWSTCLNCVHFHRPTAGCTLYNQTPPLEVVVVGCPGWDQEVPF